MHFIKILGAFFKMVSLLVSVYREKEKKKAEEKADAAKEVIDAFKQTNKKIRASRVNSAVNSINRLHK